MPATYEFRKIYDEYYSRILLYLTRIIGAEVLNLSLDNVKIQLHRARAKLKSVLNEACDFYYTENNTLACDRKQVRILSKKPE